MIDPQAAIEIFPEIDSTLLEARRRAERGEYGPVWLLARRQSAGRGRRGRTWSTVDGNLMTTYLGATALAPAQIALMGFAVGLGLAETVEEFVTPARVRLKWPNDLFIDGAKAAGLMIDCGAKPGGGAWVALSFGLNLAGAPRGLDQETISLAEAMGGARAPAPEEFLARALPRLSSWAMALERRGFAELREAWERRAYKLHEEITVVQGEDRLTGTFEGLGEEGALLLRRGTQLTAVAAGDVLTVAHGAS